MFLIMALIFINEQRRQIPYYLRSEHNSIEIIRYVAEVLKKI